MYWRISPSRIIGSSPLARGLLVVHPLAELEHGIIPARAGFTRLVGFDPPGGSDHPRSRGVYRRCRPFSGRTLGSSPLARGLPRPVQDRDAVDRIIPARAGFTACEYSCREYLPDHPRSRGVYSSHSLTSTGVLGSSPLARGLQQSGLVASQAGRIIPARAGFTGSFRPWLCGVADHPRSRGVYHENEKKSATKIGSSPLARGLLQGRHRGGIPDRIIPARAGFTWASTSTTPRATDHPRSRGVYLDGGLHECSFLGSSPLARGLRDAPRRRSASRRIIPARAGFTACRRQCGPGSGDHPRSRGVYPPRVGRPCGDQGSSPLARGLRDLDYHEDQADRIIPARAGFTQYHPRW